MSTHPDYEWLERSNAITFYHLERQGRTSPGLVPFLGAGLSTTFKFKNWKNLLLYAAPPGVASRMSEQLDKSDYVGAAETLLEELGPDAFQNMVAASAGDSHLDSFDFRKGTVSLLPLLANGPVVTTNFDRVLERAFTDNGTPFESVISGPRPDLIADALHGNRRVLIKLHGDWQDRVGRTFTKSDYDANYGPAQPEEKRLLLKGVETLLFSSRALLFIGASLESDRTVEVLEQVQKDYAGIRHFAIISVPKTKEEFEKKEKALRTYGVLPLWYQADTDQDHGPAVEKLVANIVERISVRTVQEPAMVNDARPLIPAAPIPPSVTTETDDAHFDRVVRLIEEGRLTFILGSAIHYPTDLMAEEYYQKLTRIFGCSALREERSAIAQYIADRFGRENLYAEIRKLLARTKYESRATHELFAGWRSFRTYTGEYVPFPTVITTNYDNLLERRLAAAGLPCHLLCYQSDGPHRGLFYHRTPDNGLRIIERPRNIRDFSTGFVLVKLNGSVAQGAIPESYATTRLDYWDLAARIPGVLPTAIQQTLSANPLLFLGHGLKPPDIESLVRFAHKDRSDPRSWAVAKGKTDGIEYWRQLGVEILDEDINVYVNKLRERLARNGREGITEGA
jgi:SIR2-like domain